MDKIVQTWPNLFKMDKLVQTWSNLFKMYKLVQTWSNLFKMDKLIQTWSNWLNVVQNRLDGIKTDQIFTLKCLLAMGGP